MSDDEYYDEFDDIFWIEEPEPDAAVSSTVYLHYITDLRFSPSVDVLTTNDTGRPGRDSNLRCRFL